MAGGRSYSGTIRNQSVDIVEGCPFTGMSRMRLSFPLDRVKFQMPFVPKKIWAVGKNYMGHVKEFDNDVPKEPIIFLKATTAATGPCDVIKIPAWAGEIHYEGELAVVIGQAASNVSPEEALDCVLGYSVMNDVTARELQRKDGQWMRSKSFDTFAPFGPAVLLTKEMPNDTELTTRLNGRVVQSAVIGDMIFSVPQIISYISRFATLEPGDIISTGTPQGVGKIVPGDVVEVEIDGIGKLCNICTNW